MKRIQIFPLGMAVADTGGQPAMIFKDKSEKLVLPILFEAWEGRQFLRVRPGTTVEFKGFHGASLKILQALDAEIESVYFDEASNFGLSASVKVRKGKETFDLRLPASEVLTLGLFAGVQFFSNEKVINDSKKIHLEWLLNMTNLKNLEHEKAVFGVH